MTEIALSDIAKNAARNTYARARAGRSRYLLALVLITPLMVILIGSLRVGFVSMVPNLVPILVTLALIVPMHRKR